MHLAQKWSALRQHTQFSGEHEYFQEAIRFEVCGKYPWLTAELFTLEGMLGWGPGFREYDGEFFPPPLPEAPGQMTRFLLMLSAVQSDDVIARLLGEAPGAQNLSNLHRMVFKMLHARTARRPQIISFLYDRIAMRHSPYTLGGARMFLSMWTRQHKYALAVAGLAWLLHRPLSTVHVRAETVKRKMMKTLPVATSSNTQRKMMFMHPVPVVPSSVPVGHRPHVVGAWL